MRLRAVGSLLVEVSLLAASIWDGQWGLSRAHYFRMIQVVLVSSVSVESTLERRMKSFRARIRNDDGETGRNYHSNPKRISNSNRVDKML